jgi:hypothetical protein
MEELAKTRMLLLAKNIFLGWRMVFRNIYNHLSAQSHLPSTIALKLIQNTSLWHLSNPATLKLPLITK